MVPTVVLVTSLLLSHPGPRCTGSVLLRQCHTCAACGQGYVYVEADREAHVREAVKGLRPVFHSKPFKLVPLKEMVDAVTVSKKARPLLGAPA